MKKILISIKNDLLHFSYRTSINKDQTNLLNTNIISDNELVFSEEYINENEKIVGLFIKELCIENDIHKISIAKLEMAPIILNLIKKNEYASTFIIKENCNITYALCEEVSKNKYIKTLNCYSAPTFMLEMLDKYDIKIETRNETFYTSNFMLENNLQQFSKIYYKSSIRFTPPIGDDDIEDFESFCKINRYLKTIHIYNFDNYSFDVILKIITENRLKNLKVIIHDDSNNLDDIEYLKKLNKRFKHKYKITFSISYSDDYLKNNIFKQVIINTLKICGIIIASLVIGILSYVTITNYRSMKKVASIKEDINKVLEKSKKEQEKIENSIENTPEDNKEENVVINKDIVSLKEINNDVVGWLNVPNTTVDYPVVQANNNSYYLRRNLYKEKDRNGWIFLDYRNSNTSKLDRNTIIYGHTMYNSSVMFGTLHNATKKSWYTNKDNQIITYNTIYADMKFQIFSIYKLPTTTDYLVTQFDSNEEYLDFIKLIKDRSIYNFEVDLNENDKILTLSTCSGNTNKLVIHAKLIEESNN